MQQIESCAQVLLAIRLSVAFPFQFYPTERSEVHVSSRISSVLAFRRLVSVIFILFVHRNQHRSFQLAFHCSHGGASLSFSS